MSFYFSHPGLLLLLIPITGVLTYWFFRTLVQHSPGQRMASFLTRFCILALLVLSLAGLHRQYLTTERFVMFLVDQSQSTGANADQFAYDYIQAAVRERGEHQMAVIPFARTAGFGIEQSLLNSHAAGKAGRVQRNAGDQNAIVPLDKRLPGFLEEAERAGTNLEAALEAARGSLPDGFVSEIVLLTDGNQTAGDALVAAAGSDVPVSTVPLPGRSEPEVQISGVEGPSEVREGQPFFLDVTVTASHSDRGLIEVYQGDFKVLSEMRDLTAGDNRFRFQQTATGDRILLYRVRISSLTKDTLLDNNSESTLINTAGKPRVLIAESDPSLIREFADALEDEGIQADVRPPQGVPESLAELQNYDAIIFSNVPASAVTQQQMDAVRTCVRDSGCGFMMLGGEQSFGLGGYYRSPVEEILPVRSDFEKEKEKPSLGMVLVIDRSGSMEGDKLEMARAAARSATELLGSRDQIGVLAFSDQVFVISEFQSAVNKGRIGEEISGLQSGGGTNMYPAMELAYQILNTASVRLKHVILLTDGISSNGDFESLARQMASAGITVTTVAVGGEGTTDTQLLQTIARVGKGRYYLAEEPSQVPQIFARETMTASKSAIEEQPFLPQIVQPTPVLAGIELEEAPFLLGYVRTRPRPTSEVILAAENGDPLLSWWRYGLGMSAAFTSDAKSRWAAEWLTWPGYGQFWTQVIRQIIRKDSSPGLQMTLQKSGQQTQILIDANEVDGAFLNGGQSRLTIINPQMRSETIVLHQSAPGRYEGHVLTDLPGAYSFEAALQMPGGVPIRVSRGLMVGYNEELRIHPVNTQLLRQIAAVSGGDYDPAPASLFSSQRKRPQDDIPRSRTATRSQPLWPILLTMAAVLLVIDVLLRRVDLTLLWFSSRPPGLLRSGSLRRR